MSVDLRVVKEWWAKHVNERPVWRVDDLPDPGCKGILLPLGLAYEVRRDTLVLGRPETDPTELIRTYFWEVVSCILKSYTPSAIAGIAAIRFHMEQRSIPEAIEVITPNSSTRIEVPPLTHLVIEKKPAFFEHPGISKYLTSVETPKGYPLVIESPESILLRLRSRYLRDHPALLSAFLKSTDFRVDVIRELAFEESRPVIYKRLALLFEQVGKPLEAELLSGIAKASSAHALPGKGQILKHSIPAVLGFSRHLSDAPYVVRFRDELRFFREGVEKVLRGAEIPRWDLARIQAYAEKTKKYDTYHSSTIEGYRVTPEEIQALMDGRSLSSAGASSEEVERKMALKGYLVAHQYVLKSIVERFGKGAPLTEGFIRETFAQLFQPSVDAGIISQAQLIEYRNHPVYIRHSRFVPPSQEKVDGLMRCLVEEVNSVKDDATRAILAHYGFVTVHPYRDGNGRVARFLMNYILSVSSIPWITIRIEDRDEYFKALEVAQSDGDIEPFARFIQRYLLEVRSFG